MFADPYELAGLAELRGSGGAGLGRGARARVFGPVDLEALEPQASPTVVALWGPAEPYVNPMEPCPACQARADGPCGRSAAASPQASREGCEAGRHGMGCVAGGPGACAAHRRRRDTGAGQSIESSGGGQAGPCGAAACCPVSPAAAAACTATGNSSAAVPGEAPCSGAATVALRLQAPLHARYAAPRLPADGSGWAFFAGEPATYVLLAPLVLMRCRSTSLVDCAAEGPKHGREPAWAGEDSSSGEGRAGGAALRRACGPSARLGPGRWEVAPALDGAGAAEARWRVPTGNPAHEGFVAAVTAAAFVLAAAVMVRAAYAGSLP